jgi:hypothetical protein
MAYNQEQSEQWNSGLEDKSDQIWNLALLKIVCGQDGRKHSRDVELLLTHHGNSRWFNSSRNSEFTLAMLAVISMLQV